MGRFVFSLYFFLLLKQYTITVVISKESFPDVTTVHSILCILPEMFSAHRSIQIYMYF